MILRWLQAMLRHLWPPQMPAVPDTEELDAAEHNSRAKLRESTSEINQVADRVGKRVDGLQPGTEPRNEQ